MKTTKVGTRISLRNVLYLTDFSEPSEAALPFAEAIAREYRCRIHALHVITPAMYAYATPELAGSALASQEECAERDMLKLAAQLTGLPHETIVERAIGVWPAVEQALKQYDTDLIVLGTHGRTGAAKFLLGSVAEEIFRRSHVPVLTIGPRVRNGIHGGARFHRVLFPTDFTPESLAATAYAVSFAQENEAGLILLHVIRGRTREVENERNPISVANALHELGELVPEAAELWCRPETVIDYGNPAEKILAVAQQRDADLIVLGVRDAANRLGAATHLELTTAHKVVAHAQCSVLTVRA